MKRLLLLILVSLFLTACGKENATITETVEAEENATITETVETEETIVDEQKFLTQGERIEQLGGESIKLIDIPTNVYADDYLAISEYNGCTYILTGDENEISISIVKDNKFIVKNKVIVSVASGKELGSSRGLFENHCLYATYEDGKVKGNVMTIDEKGETQHSTVFVGTPISNSTEGISPTVSMIEGLSGSYFRVWVSSEEYEQTAYAIINHKGEGLYVYPESMNNDIVLFDEYNGYLYLNAEGDYASICDLENAEMVWAEDGSEKRVYLPRWKNPVGTEDGFYVVNNILSNRVEDYIDYYSTENNDLLMEDSTTLSSTKESIIVFSTLDDKNLNVYRYVTYKGKPALQKTTFPRIDLEK